MNDYSEDALVEQPAIALFAELGWETVNACHLPIMGSCVHTFRAKQGIINPLIR